MKKTESASKIVSITVPEGLKEMLEVVPRLGYYDSLSEFIRDAIRSHLTQKRELHVLIMYNLYKERKLSLARAGVMLGLSTAATEDLFKRMEVH